MSLLLLSDASPPGADISFNGPMLAMPYSLQRLGFTYVRNSAKTVYQNNALVTLAANQFGTTYDSVTGLHAFEAEPAATNLATYSSDFSNASWVKTNVLAFGSGSIADATQAPDGTTTADFICPSTAAAVHTVSKSISPLVSGAQHSKCIFAKAGGYSWIAVWSNTSAKGAYFNLATGAIGTVSAGVTALIKPIGNGWYRCSVSEQLAATSDSFAVFVANGDGAGSFAGNGTSGVYLWGGQSETGSRATSYIATAGATVTRVEDVLSCATANIPGFTAAGYTLVVDGRKDVLASGRILVIDDGSLNNRAYLIYTATGQIESGVSSGGVSQASNTEASVSTSRLKVAYSVAANSFLRAVNGTAGTADTSGSMPVAPTTLNIGRQFNGAEFNGYIYGFKLIPVALNQAQTTGLTV